MSLPPELDDAQREAVRAAIAEAFIVGYRAVMAIAAGLALTSAGVAWLMIGPNQPRRELTVGGGDRIRRVTAGATHPRVLPAE